MRRQVGELAALRREALREVPLRLNMMLHVTAWQMELVLGALLAEALGHSVGRRLARRLRVQRGYSLVDERNLVARLDLRASDLARIH